MNQGAIQPISKTALGNFVNVAKNMEVSVYTLRELARECRKKASEAPVGPKNEIRQLEGAMNKTKNEIASLSVQRSNREKNVPKEKKLTFKDLFPRAFWVGFFIFAPLCGMISLIFSLIEGVAGEISLDEIVIFKVIGVNFLITIPIALILGSKMAKNEFSKNFKKETYERARILKNLSQGIAERDAVLHDYSSRLAHAKERLRRAEWKAEQLIKEAKELELKAYQINSVLQDCYTSIGVIGPDYRHIDCMIVFDHVFRNDLADNVRQAVFYYEEKKYRDMVLRGIDNVFQMLGKMAEVMLDVRDTLNSISGDVARMSYDLSESLDNQSHMAKTQEEALKESKAARYAAERHYAAQQAHNDYVRNQIHWNS